MTARIQKLLLITLCCIALSNSYASNHEATQELQHIEQSILIDSDVDMQETLDHLDSLLEQLIVLFSDRSTTDQEIESILQEIINTVINVHTIETIAPHATTADILNHFNIEGWSARKKASHTHTTQSQLIENQKTQIILNTFAAIAGNFATIVVDPRNPHVVGPSVANMIAGIVNIAMIGTRAQKQAHRPSNHELIITIPDTTINLLTQLIIKKAEQVHIVRT
jgi:hypothetical protein